MIAWVGPANDAAKATYKTGYLDKVTTAPEFGEIVFMGPAAKAYEMGALEGVPPQMEIVKFPSEEAAKTFYESDNVKQWTEDGGVGTKILRDTRIIAASPDLFQKGKAYWCAWIHCVVDQDKWMTYFQAFSAQNEKV